MSRKQLKSRRAYTVVEVMAAVAVFAIGVSGIIAMQKITVASNTHARRLAAATRVAQSWADQLAVDGIRWNHPSARVGTSDLGTDTVWLRQVQDPATDVDWFRPAWNVDRRFGPAFDLMGNVVADPDADANGIKAEFCTHIRLTWVYSDTAIGTQIENGKGLIRAEIRVFWLRDGGPGPVAAGRPVCSTATAVTDVTLERYHFVHLVTAIKQNTAP